MKTARIAIGILMSIALLACDDNYNFCLLADELAYQTTVMKSPQNTQTLPRIIAHAAGSYRKHSYSNSLQALENSYFNKGLRWLEVDLSPTSDQQYVLLHDWQSTWQHFFSYDQIPTRDEFMSLTMKYDLTQMDIHTLADWMYQHEDAMIVLDIKASQPLDALRQIAQAYPDLTDRMVPELFELTDFEESISLGYNLLIPSLYRLKINDEDLLAFIEDNPHILAVAMPKEKAQDGLPQKLFERGAASFVHTINTVEGYYKYRSYCSFGCYSDNLPE